MNEQINIILSELYEIDPEFRKHEEKLIKIINELLVARPEARIDDEFVKELRLRIMSKAGDLSGAKKQGTGNLFYFMNLNKPAYALGALGIIILIITPVLLLSQYKGGQSMNVRLSSGIKELSENAFGEITSSGLAAMSGQDGRGFANMESADQKMVSTLGMGGSDGEMAGSMIAPEFVNYNYVYKGDEFTVEGGKMKVYRRADLSGGKEFAGILSQVNFDLINMSQFKDAKVTSINLNEEKEFGYSVYLSFVDNSLSLYKNWNKWPQDNDAVMYRGGEKAMPSSQNNWGIKDIPADNRIIAVADSFLKDFGINMSYYEAGEVQDGWRRQYDMAENKEFSYVPQEITVVYPFVIEGKTAYDQGGNKTGLHVGVDVKYNKVASLSQVKAHSFESSMYDVVTDKDVILETALNGGSNNYFYRHDNPARTVDIELGTPELRLVSYWRHNEEKGTGEELFVPSYIFPVIGQPNENNYYFNSNVVVPLVEGLIETYRYGVEPMPIIMDRGDSPVSSDDEVNALPFIEPDQIRDLPPDGGGSAGVSN